jgi:hypothetical protein
LERVASPDGALLVELSAVEWSNTHWVRSPRVTDTGAGAVLLDLWGTDWDAWPDFPRPGVVRLGLRRYRGGEADVELDRDGYRLFEGEAVTAGPLADLPDALARRSLADAPPRPPIPQPRVTTGGLRAAALILACAIAAIAAITWATLKIETAARPPQHLDAIPPMPKFTAPEQPTGQSLHREL